MLLLFRIGLCSCEILWYCLELFVGCCVGCQELNNAETYYKIMTTQSERGPLASANQHSWWNGRALNIFRLAANGPSE